VTSFNGVIEVECENGVTFVWLKSSTGYLINSWSLHVGEAVRIGPLEIPTECSSGPVERPRERCKCTIQASLGGNGICAKCGKPII
jgi:hypothetical protein